ncbi:sensor histidine kinase [Actinomarinicola tropica]|nr:ATP-binding protein [Actinomarinicola tropica]
MPHDRFVVPAALRRAGMVYAASTVPLCGVLWWSVDGRHEYLDALLLAGLLYAVPILVLALVASVRAAPGDRHVWRLWAGSAAFGTFMSYSLRARAADGWDPATDWSPVSSVVAIVVLIAANSLILRRRSGERAALVDAIDLLMATIAATTPLALVWGRQVVTHPDAWFTVSSGVWLIGSFHGLFVALAIRARTRHDERATATAGVVLGLAGVLAAIAQIHHALSGFPAPGGPALMAQAASLGMIIVFFLFSTRTPATGLERLPAAAQVRRQSVVIVGVLVAVPVIAGVAWARREHDWVTTLAFVALSSLLALSAVRHLLSARETTRLYREVERAAIERGEILSEVMDHMDAGRHRVAAHLHAQAVSLYTAMATISASLDDAGSSGATASATQAAARVRHDLGKQADALRRFSLAVKPLDTCETTSQGLAAPIRAYVENVFAGGRRPALDLHVDPDLTLDWRTEAIVMRIVQEATTNVWRHARATAVRVAIEVERDVLRVEVGDDGVGMARPPAGGRGLSSMESLAGFLGGRLRVTTGPGEGTTVRAELPIDALPRATRPTLSVVR